MEAMNNLIALLECKMVPEIAKKQHQDEKHKVGQYPYIPFSPTSFCEDMQNVMRLIYPEGYLSDGKKRLKFIDVGCGMGTKLVLAHYIFRGYVDIHGIEITKEYVKAARALARTRVRTNYAGPSKPKFTVLHSDALKLSYEPYDVIYFYCPLSDPKLERELESRILSTAKPGTILVPHLRQSEEKLWYERCEPLFGRDIWRLR